MSGSVAALAAAVTALLLGPGLLRAAGDSAHLRAALDGFALTLVAGLCLLHLGPHAIDSGGAPALGGIVVGALLPGILHSRVGDRVGGWLAVALLALHAVLDGAVLALASADLTLGVAVAVVAHRLPVGLGVTVGADSVRRAGAILGALGALTLAGFAGAAVVGAQLPPALQGPLDGVIIGGLLHIVFAHRLSPPDPASTPTLPVFANASSFKPVPDGSMLLVNPVQCAAAGCGTPGHTHDHSHDTLGGVHHHHPSDPVASRASAGGVLLGVLLLLALGVFAATGGDKHLVETGTAFVSITLVSAPALLAGFLLASLAIAYLKPAHTSWLASGSEGTRAVRGVVFGLPLPICSCGVVPMYESLVRRGVPLSAGLAFLVATPELGVDAVLLSAPLLGIPLTVARVLAAFGVAVLVAVLVARTDHSEPSISQPSEALGAPPPGARLAQGLRFGFVELVDHTLPWVLAGLVLAAIAEPLLDHELLATVPAAVQVPLAAVVGVPLYVCASGATPLAAIAMHKGLSAGAALTFLLAGPATNLTTFGVLTKLHGRKLAIRFGLALVLLATAVGWGVDLLDLSIPLTTHPAALLDQHTSWLSGGAAVGLLLLTCASLWRQGARGLLDQLLEPIHTH